MAGYTNDQRDTIAALAADALFASSASNNTHADYGTEREALGAAVGEYLASNGTTAEGVADTIQALLAPFGDGTTEHIMQALLAMLGDTRGDNFGRPFDN